MFYGRLDVYWPDGPIESYRLEKPTTAIGRSSGNDIVLDTTAVSRYHVTLTARNQQVVLEDLESVNGTYVDGVLLKSNQPHVLRGGEEIQIGDIRLIYNPPIEPADLTDTTQRITFAQPTYKVELQGPDMAVAPGAHVQAVLKIENISEETDQYYIEVDGLPKGWVRVDRTEIRLEPEEQGQAIISFKPLRRSESQPGDHPFVVRVRSKSRPAQTVDAPTTLRVLPFSGFGLALSTSRVEASEGFNLYLHNQGNAPLQLDIQGLDPLRRLSFQLPQARITLGPGERQTMTGTVAPRRRRIFGAAREYEFVIAARAHDASSFVASVPATYVEKSALPTWAPVLALPLLALVVLLGAGLLLLFLSDEDDTDPTEPVVLSFTASSPAVLVGEPVELAWDVTDAESLDLWIDNGVSRQEVALAPDSTPYTVTLDQSGLFTLILRAHNAGQTAIATLALEVRPAVNLRLEVLGGTDLVRYVNQDVRVSWSVTGAEPLESGYNLWVEGPDGTILVTSPVALSGYQDVRVAPDTELSEWLATLYASGQGEVMSSVTQKLSVIYPNCQLNTGSAAVHGGPGEAYPTIVPPLENSAEGSISLAPLARDPSGEWLLAPVGAGDPPVNGWLRLRDLTCTNFDPAQLRETTDFPPPPTATPSRTPTAFPATATPGPTTATTATPTPR
ncbi:MAG: FHA domain-containing protein [Chloroflexi bacterium]|nr:FHA domain-containing protein [Chloroflexota bacterium]